MFRLSNYHPNAFLSLKKNIKPGLSSRTKIMSSLEKQPSTTSKLSRKTLLNYNTVIYHLHLLENENVVQHKGRHVYIWKLTGLGQQKLMNKD
ncbi:MAG: winged helix-turn-helix domain-containing protein [Candidatus Bathyarchaeota archaeon]